MNNRKKITGENRKLYIWNERVDDYASARRRQPRQEVISVNRGVSAITLALILGSALLAAALYGGMKVSVARVNERIETQQTDNANVADEIASYKMTISEATRYSTIAQLAEEKQGMINSEKKTTSIVYIPGRNGTTLTADAGGK